MHYFFDSFDKICVDVAAGPQNLSNIVSRYGFKSIRNPLAPLVNNGKYLVDVYSVTNEHYSLTIEISTDVEHACYSDQDETHYIAVSLCENNNLINSKTYTYSY